MSPMWFFSCVLLGNGLLATSASPERAFTECLVSQPQGTLGYCLGYSALTKLHSFHDSPEFALVDGLTFARDAKLYRDEYSFGSDGDPGDYRSILDAWGQVFQSRTMRWDMAFLYPGLAMRLAPASTGGILEFVMNQPNPYQQHALKEASSGRILARHFLVPLLLGFKFNVATLIPVIFGLISLIVTKALVLGKIALVISSAFGLGSLLFAQQPAVHPHGYQTTYNPSFGGHLRVPDDGYHDAFRSTASNSVPADPTIDQLRLYDTDPQQAFRRVEQAQKEGRNFAWSDADKTTTTPH